MVYIKFIQYVYLAAGFCFLWFAYEEYQAENKNTWLYVAFSVFAFVTFVLRRKFAKRMEENKKQNQDRK